MTRTQNGPNPISEEEFMSDRTCCCKKLSLVFVLLALAILAVPAFAQTCLQDEYTAGGGGSLVCTANDVSVAQVVGIRDPATGKTLSTCFQGTHFNFLSDFEVVTTSKSSRSNIGLYFATNSTTQALTGACVDNIIQPPHACPSNASITCGSDNYHELDTSPDNCGDTSSTDSSPLFGAAAEGVTIEVDNFLCQAPAGSTTLVLPNCTSWQVPGKQNLCTSNPPLFPYPAPPAAVPGSPSKCNCSIISLPITPVSVTASITKSCVTSITTTAGTSCDEGVQGLDPATYTVTITPTVSTGSTIVDQICDTAYGTVYDDDLLSSGTRVFPTCAKGSVGGTLTNNTCASGLTILNGQSGSCQFTAPAIGEPPASVTDQVTASGHSSVNPSSTFTTPSSNTVNVYSEDAPASATVAKGYLGTEAGCATVRYSVEVDNTSSYDETETLSALSDSTYGDITKLGTGTPPIVLGTNCGGTAIGTLAGVTVTGFAGGAFGAIAPGSNYKCAFDGQFCSAVDVNTCISETDSVTGTLTSDETTDKSFTQKANTLTVKECFMETTTTVP